MGEMGMPVPRNSIPMVGMQGKHDYIDMGGLFTIVKVRENLTSYDDLAGTRIRQGRWRVWPAMMSCSATWGKFQMPSLWIRT